MHIGARMFPHIEFAAWFFMLAGLNVAKLPAGRHRPTPNASTGDPPSPGLPKSPDPWTRRVPSLETSLYGQAASVLVRFQGKAMRSATSSRINSWNASAFIPARTFAISGRSK